MEQGAVGYERESCCRRRRKLTGFSMRPPCRRTPSQELLVIRRNHQTDEISLDVVESRSTQNTRRFGICRPSAMPTGSAAASCR